jgi:soluble lytic murein transglycosylase-like protein
MVALRLCVAGICLIVSAPTAAGADTVDGQIRFNQGWDAVRAGRFRPPEKPAAPPVPVRAAVVPRLACFAEIMNVPVDLALALADVESGFQAQAISSKGAKGLLQVMPETARSYSLDPDRLLDAEYGSYSGLRILQDLLSRFPVDAALAAYYAGPQFFQKRFNDKTRDDIAAYVRLVQQRRRKYAGYRSSKCG